MSWPNFQNPCFFCCPVHPGSLNLLQEKWKGPSLSRVWLCVTPWTVAHQAPLSVKFSRQEYWSGLPFPPPGDLPDPGIEPTSLTSPALAFFTIWATREAHTAVYFVSITYLPWVLNFVNFDQFLPPAPSNHHSTLCFYEFGYFNSMFFKKKRSNDSISFSILLLEDTFRICLFCLAVLRRILVPWPGMEPMPLQRKHRALSVKVLTGTVNC